MSTATVSIAAAKQVYREVGHPVRVDILVELAQTGGHLSPNAFRQRKVDEILATDPRCRATKAARQDDAVAREIAEQIADDSGYTLGAISYHFRTLFNGTKNVDKMIDLADETRVRGAVEHHYKPNAKGRKVVKPLLVIA